MDGWMDGKWSTTINLFFLEHQRLSFDCYLMRRDEQHVEN